MAKFKYLLIYIDAREFMEAEINDWLKGDQRLGGLSDGLKTVLCGSNDVYVPVDY